MAGNLTDYSENQLLEHITGRTAYTKPTNTFFGLLVVSPTDSTTGTEVATSGGYLRQQMSWGAAASGAIANNATIRFPASGSTTANWGTIVAVGIYDALTAGNLLWWGPLSASVTISTGDSWTLTSGAVTLALD